MPDASAAGARFCDEDQLNYAGSRRVFTEGAALGFDDGYRLAHLPLVAPGHPKIIAAKAGTDYERGRYAAARHALVVPIDAAALAESAAFRAVDEALRAGRFAPKIAFALGERRAAMLHATLVSGLAEEAIAPVAAKAGAALARLGPVSARIGGPFLGRINTGRIYLPLYPEKIAGEDAFGLIQEACGGRRTRFYGAGYYHLAEELTAAETAELAEMAVGWPALTLGIQRIDALAILSTHDDLALSGRIARRITAAAG